MKYYKRDFTGKIGPPPDDRSHEEMFLVDEIILSTLEELDSVPDKRDSYLSSKLLGDLDERDEDLLFFRI
jgi:hypothetical protein